MFKIISNRELAVYIGTINDLKRQVEALKAQVEHERKRAEGAINLLLMRTVKAAITPQDGISLEQENDLKDRLYDIWGDEKQLNEEELLDKLQS